MVIHGPDFDIPFTAAMINANNPGRLPIRLLSCGAEVNAQRLASALGYGSVETTPASLVATMFPVPIPVALTLKPWYPVYP